MEQQQNTLEYPVVDLRADYVAPPTEAMKKAMVEANFGVEAFGDDKDVIALQDYCASLFGMEDAIFVPSGCMANLIATMCHCRGERGMEIIVGHLSHMVVHEQGSHSVVAGVHSRQIINNPDGTFDLTELETLIRPTNDYHHPYTGMIAVEQTHNMCGGAVVPIEFLKGVKQIADKYKIPVHMDGARLLNASVALGVPVADIVQYVHSVSMCFSKGIGAPAGSILAGSKDFIMRALRIRKLLGGALRQPGGLAVASLCGLKESDKKLKRDHIHAGLIADVIRNNGTGIANLVGGKDKLQTNILMIELKTSNINSNEFCQMLAKVQDDEDVKVSIRCMVFSPTLVRMVTSSAQSENDIVLICKKLRFVLERIRSFSQ